MDSQAPYRTLQQGEMLNWYRIERILGRGGFGVIYLATDTNLEHLVAIKEYIPSNIATRAENSSVQPISSEQGELFHWGMDRFIKEARNLVKFKHPNIVRVMSVFEQNNTAYMVMEFEEGDDLRSYLRQPGSNTEQNLRRIIVPICKGLAEVHRHGFIHRDVKPANILVRKDGSPVLLDFGSARNASQYTRQSMTALVSVGYAPLEQYNDDSEQQQGPWTDIYALGGTLYFAVSGKDPVDSTRRATALFNGGQDPLVSAQQLGAGRYSEGFLKSIDWAMSFRIADRPQTVAQWIPSLLDGAAVSANTASNTAVTVLHDRAAGDITDGAVLSGERIARPSGGPEVSGTRRIQRRRSTALRNVALLVLLVSASAIAYWYSIDKRQDAESQMAGSTTQVEPESLDVAAQQAERDRIAAIENAEIEKRQAEAEEAARLAASEAAKKVAQEKIDEAARQKLEQERVDAEATRRAAAAAAAAQQKRLAAARAERRLKQAIGSAEGSMNVGDLDAARSQLSIARGINASDARVKSLEQALQRAQLEHDRPISDAEFDAVTRSFDRLRKAIEAKDTVTMDRLAVASDQSDLFKALMNRFDKLEVSINGIRARNADKSVAAILQINAMVRQNGDRATPSDAYRTREIKSRRVNGGWSKIVW